MFLRLFFTALTLQMTFQSSAVSKRVDYSDLISWSQQCNLGQIQSPIDLRVNNSFQYCDYNKVNIGFMDGNLKLKITADSQDMEIRHYNSIISIVDYDKTL